MSPCSRRSAGAGAAGARAAPIAPETVCGLCWSARRAPGELPARSRHTAPSRSRWKGAAAAPHRSPLPAASTSTLRATALLADWATFLRATQPCASPAHTTGGLFAELQLIYGPCYLNINYGPARQAPRLLPSRLIIF